MTKLWPLLAVTLLPPPAQADFGFANSGCARWLDPDLADQEFARRQWVFGYLSAYNRYGDRDITNTDPNEWIDTLRAHCSAHPRDSLESAAEALLLQLPAEEE